MGMEYMIGGMVTYIKDFGWTISGTVKALFYIIMKFSMMDIGKTVKR